MRKWAKSVVSWQVGDTLYLSVPFSWMLDEAKLLASQHKGRVVAGGPAVAMQGASWADETPTTCPHYDVLAMHNPCATFTTRGCIRKCKFCAVPKIEGDFQELETWKPAPIICDNNLTAASKKHWEKVIDSLQPFPACDFNQGLDARLFTRWHADQIARLKSPTVRFALDHVSEESAVIRAIENTRAAGLKRIGVYVLIGFDDTPEDALYRLELIRSLNIRPNPMRFQPLDASTRNGYVSPAWPEAELKRMVRYYSRLRWLEHIPYHEFNPPEPSLFDVKEIN